jgi:hypothetical protein
LKYYTGLSTSSGFKTPSGVVVELLTANGSVNSTALPNIATNTSNIATNTSSIATLNTKTQNIDSALTDNTKTHFTNKVHGTKLQANNLIFSNEISSKS